MDNKIVWKDSAPYALCLTHDVDRIQKQWYHYIVYSKRGISSQLKSLSEKIKGNEPYNNFKYIAELEMSYGARSTFLFLNESHKEVSTNFMGRYKITAPAVVSAIKWLDLKGFEIGLHGSFFSYNNEGLLKKEKDILENIVGHPIVSTRQHFLNHDETTWQIQKNVGLHFDSTIGNKKTTGEDFPVFPYYTAEGILEMPITVMDSVSLESEDDMKTVLKACDSVAKRGGLVMLNFHQRQLRKTEYPYIVKTYKYLLEKAQKDGAWMATMGEIGSYIVEGWQMNNV